MSYLTTTQLSSTSFERWRNLMLLLARCSLVLLLYGTAASMALATAGSILLLVFWVLSLDWIRTIPRLLDLPIFWPLVLLFLMVPIGMIYSSAPPHYSIRYFRVYACLTLVLVIIAVVNDSAWHRRCWNSFFIGALVTISSTYLGVWFSLPWSQSQTTGLGVNHSVFYDYIAQGVMTCFVSVVALAHILTESTTRRKVFWLIVLAIATFSLTHLLTGRTGQVLYVLAFTSVIFASLPPRRALITTLFFIAFLVIILTTSPTILSKFFLIISEIRDYQQGNESTSIGARLAMWSTSLSFLTNHPLLGHGTGSYRWLSEQVFTDATMCRISCIHPHNQFLFFGVEYGFIGVSLYCWLFAGLGKIASELMPREKLILIGLSTMIFIDSFINSPFWISSERNFYTAALGLAIVPFYLSRSTVLRSKEHSS